MVSGCLVRNNERLAFCSVSRLEAAAALLSTHSTISGRIGSVSLRDLTPAGALYPDVFSTVGDDILLFELATLPAGGKDGVAYADVSSREASRRSDAPHLAVASRLKVHMGSIRYVHTRRFLTQLTNFAAQLQNTQQVLHQMRLMAEGVVAELQKVSYASLLRLDVKIDSPVVVVPRNSLSLDVLEADLGRTSMSNVIYLHPPLDVIPDGITGSFGAIEGLYGVVDCICIDVRDMRLCSARHVPPTRPDSSASSSGERVATGGGGTADGGLPNAAPERSSGSNGALSATSQRGSRARAIHRLVLHTSNLDDSEDGLSSEDNWSDTGSDGMHATRRQSEQPHVREVSRHELLSECNLTVAFARNFSLERRDLPNTSIDVHVSNVDVKVRWSWGRFDRTWCKLEMLRVGDAMLCVMCSVCILYSVLCNPFFIMSTLCALLYALDSMFRALESRVSVSPLFSVTKRLRRLRKSALC